MTFESVLKSMYSMLYKGMHMIKEYDYTVVFSLAILIIVGWALVILITKAFSYSAKVSRTCNNVCKFLKKNDKIDQSNLEKFNQKCFGKSAAKTIRGRWQVYLRANAGIPSDFLTNEQCLARNGVGRGINRGRLLTFRYVSILVGLLATGYCLHYILAPVVMPPVDVVPTMDDVTGAIFNFLRILPGIALIAGVTLICDLFINWVFSLADNGAVKDFYKMTDMLDNMVELTVVNNYEELPQEQTYANQEYVENIALPEQYDQVYDQTYNQVYEQAPTYDYQEPSYEELNGKTYEDLPPVETEYKEPTVEEAPAVEAPAPAPVRSANAEKMAKIDKLVDRAIASNASKQTYLGLAKMLIDASKNIDDELEKAQLKACTTKLLAKIKK